MSKKLDRVNGIVEKLQDKITIDENGVGTVEAGAVASVLPEGITEDSITQHDQAKSDVASAIAIVFGSKSKAVFDKNKDMKEASLSTKIGANTTVNVNQKREVSFQNLADPKKPIVRHGYVRLGMVQYGTLDSKAVNEHDTVKKVWGGLSD